MAIAYPYTELEPARAPLFVIKGGEQLKPKLKARRDEIGQFLGGVLSFSNRSQENMTAADKQRAELRARICRNMVMFIEDNPETSQLERLHTGLRIAATEYLDVPAAETVWDPELSAVIDIHSELLAKPQMADEAFADAVLTKAGF
jgi:hypothetical protein